MTFEVYYETYSLKEKRIVRKNVGISTGISFQDACSNFAQENQDFAKQFNLNALSYQNHELYGTLLN